MLLSTIYSLLAMLLWPLAFTLATEAGNDGRAVAFTNDLATRDDDGQEFDFIFTYGDQASGKVCHAAIRILLYGDFSVKPTTNIYVSWVYCAASGNLHEGRTRVLTEDQDLPIVDLIFQERYRLSSGPHWRYQIVLNQDQIYPSGGGVEFGIPEMQPRADMILSVTRQGQFVVDHFCNFFGGGIQMARSDGSEYRSRGFEPLPHPDPGPSRREPHRDYNPVCHRATGHRLVTHIGVWLLCFSFCKPHPKRDVELLGLSETRSSLLEAEGWKRDPLMGGWYEAPEGTDHLPRSVMELDQWAEERGLQL